MTFEFKAAVSPDGQICIPSDVAGQIPAGKELQIVLSWEAGVDGSSYRALGQKLHEASAYASSEETVYDSFA
jgi:hypothetical protein